MKVWSHLISGNGLCLIFTIKNNIFATVYIK